ncbi:MAG: hypothetical protein CBR30_02750 [Dictyoglomus sp. NZ13-RE01]|nr:MAG: hypothetical protein CBR30_02750 [Dictyoglomus sp. NZ13-RE01]
MFFEFTVSTNAKSALVDITSKVEECILKSNVRNGVCYIFVPHTTAGVIINENYDPSVSKDILQVLEKLVPWIGNYAHIEGNSAAHIRSSILGNTTFVLIQDGRMKLGTWQGIFLAEFDGPRTRRVWVDIIEDKM